MMCGRLGALSGNLLFPVLVQVGCLPPFVMVAAVMFRKLSNYSKSIEYFLFFLFFLTVASALSYFVPNPKKATFT